MEEEMFVSGFCKAQNQSRMVLCEVRVDAQGTVQILDTDCAWGKCPHSDGCLLMENVKGNGKRK